MLIKEIPKSERPRERMLKYGVHNLSNEELLAIIIKSGTNGYSAKDIAISILKRIEDITNLKNLNMHTLDNIKGLGQVKKQELLVLVELGRRIYLNNTLKTEKKYIERKLLFMGTIDRSLIHPREVFKNAYLCSASAFICIHNHPSGDVMPSKADLEVTKTLLEIGRIQGIDLIDHIIVGDNNYFSFFENHLME